MKIVRQTEDNMKIVKQTDDAIYISFDNPDKQPTMPKLYTTIDWVGLAEQKMALLNLISCKQLSTAVVAKLDGLVSLIDFMQDDADAKGFPVVWAHNPKDLKDAGLVEEENNE